MKKTLTRLVFPALMGTALSFSAYADDCFTPLFPDHNLIKDAEVTDLSNFAGWGNKIIVTTDDEGEHVYCGTTSGKVWGVNGGSIDAGNITMKSNSYYRIKAMIYVDGPGMFQIGCLGLGDVVQTTSAYEWEVVDHVFNTGNNNCTGLYFNNYGREGDIGYIDNWELYQWPDVEGLESVLEKVFEKFDPSTSGYADLNALIDKANELIANPSPENVDEFTSVSEQLKQKYLEYLTDNASAGSPQDVSFIVTNTNFDVNAAGWSNTTGLTNQTANNQDGDFEGNYLENYSNKVFEGKIYQTLKNMPTGTYKLEMAAFAIRQSSAAPADDENAIDEFIEGPYIFANGSKTSLESEIPSTYDVTCTVTDGTLEIGLYAVNNNWVGFDNVSLTYMGFDLSGLIETLNNQVAEARAYADLYMQASVLNQLNTAITNTTSAINNNPTKATLESNAKLLTEAVEAAISSIDAYLSFKDKLAEADAVKDASLSGYNDYIAAVNAAQAIYNAKSADEAGVAEAIVALNKAMLDYRVANVNSSNPIDLTEFIVNPNFENDGNVAYSEEISGWINSGFQTQTNSGMDPYKDGSVFVEKWRGSGALDDAEIYQIITGLPNGLYELSAVAYCTQDGASSTGAFLYGNNVTKEVGIHGTYDLKVNVIDETLKIGFKLQTCLGNWVGIDNLKLKYYGYDLEALIDQLIDLSLVVETGIDGETGVLDMPMQKDVKAELKDAFDDTVDAVNNPTKEKLEDAYARLLSAYDAAKISYEMYLPLTKAYYTALDYTFNLEDVEGFDDFILEIAKAEDTLAEGLINDSEEIVKAAKELEAAQYKFLWNQTDDYDATFALINPSFEADGVWENNGKQPTGWEYYPTNYSWTGVNPDGDTATKDGTYIFGIWNANVSDFEVSQTAMIPNGKYKVTCGLMVSNQGRDASMSRLFTQRLFAGNDEDGYQSQLYGSEDQYTEYNLDELLNMNETYSFAGHAESGMTGDNGPFEPMEVTVEITNHKLKFGIRSEGTASTKDFDFNLDDRTLSTGGVGWFKTDNFKLHCLERGELYNSIHSVGTDNGFRIYSFENCLVIDTDVATQINIYGIDGMLINAMKVEAGSTTVTLQPGFYVINGTKVVIK